LAVRPLRLTQAAVLVLRAARALAALFAVVFVHDRRHVVFRLDWIATVPPTVKIATNMFGRERAGIVFGWVFAAHQLGAATAAYGAGLSRTLAATYLPAFYLAGAACLVASLLILAVRPASGAVSSLRQNEAAT